MTTFDTLLNKLHSDSSTIKLGLDRVLLLDNALGCPSKAFPSIHIAGTNGKGSVATKIASVLQQSGYNTGLFTSPHIDHFSERIQINGQPITEESCAKLLKRLFDVENAHNTFATFFERTTLLALIYFANKPVDIAIIETGLGGRLDATNIILPLLSVITSISYDHTNILGNSIEEIAREKAGIIKAHTPLILGPNTPPNKLFESIAKEKKCPVSRVQERYTCYDKENQAIAKKALETLPKSFCIDDKAWSGLTDNPACRFDIHQRETLTALPKATRPKAVILDVAHNPDGLQRLFQKIAYTFPKESIVCVTSIAKGRPPEQILSFLKKHAIKIFLIENEMTSHLDDETMTKYAPQQTRDPKEIASVVADGCRLAHERNAIIVACGSCYTMHTITQALNAG
ncbi:hypothetical protein JYU14_03200 [Simkania negevensis]|uniref:Mur ligase central domain-containing protein n=1 Tax=Simkania negevensis TaxID=83561 RepID=A0ABS3ARU0_9BACT|nr:hypothetical protein [Simkania negevensis]